jgi:hypothetical protein
MSQGDEPISGPPDLTPARFAAILAEARSPAAPFAGTIYDAFVVTGVRPSITLAFFKHESRFGTQGVAATYNTRNWGNVRSAERPELAGAPVETPRGRFATYPTWTAGALDWSYRLTGPKYAGRGLLTVRQVLPVYAPPSDGNDPDAYADAVIADVRAWVGSEPMPEPQLTTRVSLLPAGMPNNPDRAMWDGKPAWVTIHETDNPNVGANAEMHRRFVLGGGGPDTASFHAVCDDRESIQLMPWTAAAYHIGDGDGGAGNNSSLGIELCVNADDDFRATTTRGAELAAALLRRFGLPLERLRQHGDWWSPANPDVHRGCPAHLKAGDRGITWLIFRLRVQQALAGAGDDFAVAVEGASDLDSLLERILA